MLTFRIIGAQERAQFAGLSSARHLPQWLPLQHPTTQRAVHAQAMGVGKQTHIHKCTTVGRLRNNNRVKECTLGWQRATDLASDTHPARSSCAA